MKITIPALVEGGKATAGPPLGPALGPLGVNIGQIIAEINEKTKAYNGISVPVKVIVDKDTKKFEVEVGSPPASALIKKELGITKGRQGIKEETVKEAAPAAAPATGADAKKKEEEKKKKGEDEVKKKAEEEKKAAVTTATAPVAKKEEIVGNMTIEQAVKIAKMKQSSSLSKDLKAGVKEVLGTCVSMGVNCEGKDPRKIIKEINEGKHDTKLK
ncbi:50S ribosomal protein L11 [Candidatus Micrarchaeota archaeon]|nr:50S ribosomal protein L11 [Candidatus Micrarchaeota archaeon]